MREYYLMNKDRQIAKFQITGEDKLEYCQYVEKYIDLPIWLSDIDSWVDNRNATKHRKHIKDMLTSWGCDNKSGFISITHCLSLNDTLWVMSVGEDVSWRDLSLYENEFNTVISHLSFDGTGLYGVQFSTTMPECSTDGTFNKCWIREGGDIKLLKAGLQGFSNSGREPYSEVLASQVYSILCHNAVEYELDRYHGTVVSKCNLFTSEDIGFKPMSVYVSTSQSLPGLMNRYDEIGRLDDFRRMVVADAVCFNQDRHLGNFGYLIDNNTFEVIAMAPVFDFNMSMLTYADDRYGFNNIDEYLKEIGPKIGDDFIEDAKLLLTDDIRADLLRMRDLTLHIETDEKFTNDRLEQINILKNMQIDKILRQE